MYCTNENITAQRTAEQREREVAEQMRLIMKNISGGICAALYTDDGEIEIIFANDMFYNMYGYTKQQFETELASSLDAIYPNDRAATIAAVKQLIKDGGSTTYKYRCIKRDGSIIHVRCNNSVRAFAGISDTVLLSVTTDITEVSRAQEKEHTLSEQLQAIMRNINGGVTATVLLGENTRFLYVNDKYYAQLGYTEKEFEAEVNDVFALVHPDDRKALIKKTLDASEQQKAYTCTYRVIRRDKSIRWMLSNISIMKFPGVDEPVQLAVANDITEQVEAEQKERRTSEQMQAIMDNVGMGITATVIKNDNAEFLFSNNRYYEILGYTKEQYAAEVKNPYLTIYPEDRQRMLTETADVNRTGRSALSEYRVLRRDGNAIWMRSTITTAKFAGIDSPVQLAIYRDITEEKTAEEALLDSDAQLRFLNETAHDLLAQPDAETGIYGILNKLMVYFSATRAYIFEFDKDKDIIANTYEVCAEGIVSDKEKLRESFFTKTSDYLRLFEEYGYYLVEDIDAIDDARAEEKARLKAKGIKSTGVVPLYRDGIIIGMLGVDDLHRHYQRIDRLVALGDYIAVMLTRRDLNAKLLGEKNKMPL